MRGDQSLRSGLTSAGERVAVFCEDAGSVGEIEVREAVEFFDNGSTVLVTDTEVRRELRRDAVVILEEEKVQVLAVVDDRVGCLRMCCGHAQQKVSPRVVGEDTLGESEGSDERGEIHHRSLDVLLFHAGSQ